jgi:hypothetical protein
VVILIYIAVHLLGFLPAIRSLLVGRNLFVKRRRAEEMIVKELVQLLEDNPDASLHFMLPNYDFIPSHFHVTEVGRVQKTFIDCGGTNRESTSCVFQIWTAHDTDHRLTTKKLVKILSLAKSMELDELSIEVEYGANVASQYKVVDAKTGSSELVLILAGKQTDCLAPDKCGITECDDSDSCCC